jgi:iron complex transport system ATP-binding protein
MNSRAAMQTVHLDFSFADHPVLNDIGLTVERGKFYAILGPNGSGKTTLLRNIAGILGNRRGAIFINDADLKNIDTPALARQLTVVPQDTVIQFDFTALEMVLMGRSPYIPRFGTETEEDLQIVREAMEITSTWHLKDRSINSLSGGERQRVIVARAFAQKTGIILLDEPVSHLDLYHQIELLKHVKTLNQSQQATVLAVLHDLNLAAAFSDVMILMKQGSVYCQGEPGAVLQPEIIREVYGVEARIVANPDTGLPVLIPIII